MFASGSGVADTAEGQASEPLSVSAAMALAKGALESCTVKLIGEVSEVSNKPGYKAVYFTVKDTGASLPCMMWLNRYQAAGVDLRVGMLVELSGRFTLYAPKGRMNFDVFSVSLAGEGNLRLQVANLAKKLEAEGLMDASRKKPLPRLPETIGLVTSPRGAAVHDVMRTLRRRYPLARVLLAGVAVEGEYAALGLMEGLKAVQDAGAEAVLLVRGGGSFEDMMPFNDERLARYIAGMKIPVVTGIGHEPDTCIADMVADVRASTPTGAAEAASPSAEMLAEALAGRRRSIEDSLQRQIDRLTASVERVAARPIFEDPNQLFAQEAQMLDMASMRLHRAIPLGFQRDSARLDQARSRLTAVGGTLLRRFENSTALAASRLNDLSPLEVIARGYSIARQADGRVVKSIEDAAIGEDLQIMLIDGNIDCSIVGITEDPARRRGLENTDDDR